jgi:hypothetical protein
MPSAQPAPHDVAIRAMSLKEMARRDYWGEFDDDAPACATPQPKTGPVPVGGETDFDDEPLL